MILWPFIMWWALLWGPFELMTASQELANADLTERYANVERRNT